MITPVVLVHGMWHGSWCWSRVAGLLAAAGVPSLAVDLEGHGLKGRSPEARWSRPFDPAAFATEPAPSAGRDRLLRRRRPGGRDPPGRRRTPLRRGRAQHGRRRRHRRRRTRPRALRRTGLPRRVRAGQRCLRRPTTSRARRTRERTCPPCWSGIRLWSARCARTPAAAPGTPPSGRRSTTTSTQATADAAIGLLSPDGPAGMVGETLTITPDRYGSVPHTYLVCTEDRAVPPPCNAASSRRSTRCPPRPPRSSSWRPRTRRSCPRRRSSPPPSSRHAVPTPRSRSPCEDCARLAVAERNTTCT